MQEDGACGLQIQHNKEWVPVNPILNALVVNVGDVIEVYKTDYFFRQKTDILFTIRILDSNGRLCMVCNKNEI
ncbi:hypothetical protein CRYUN_Cryun09bG0018300 [Craigia yunnanensis]